MYVHVQSVQSTHRDGWEMGTATGLVCTLYIKLASLFVITLAATASTPHHSTRHHLPHIGPPENTGTPSTATLHLDNLCSCAPGSI